MEIKNNLCSDAVRKIGLLIREASRLSMDLSGYGFADENQNSGNVYIWLEDYPFCLYIGLHEDTIYALWANPEDGEEHDKETAGIDLKDLYAWVSSLESASEVQS